MNHSTHVTNIQRRNHYMQTSEADYHISVEVNVFCRRQTVKVNYLESVETVFSFEDLGAKFDTPYYYSNLSCKEISSLLSKG